MDLMLLRRRIMDAAQMEDYSRFFYYSLYPNNVANVYGLKGNEWEEYFHHHSVYIPNNIYGYPAEIYAQKNNFFVGWSQENFSVSWAPNIKIKNDYMISFFAYKNYNSPMIIPDGVKNVQTICYYVPYNAQIFNKPVSLPNSVQMLYSTFYECHEFNQNIQIPQGVKSMIQVFYNCYNFDQNIQFPSSMNGLAQSNLVTSCFKGCWALNQSIQLPKNCNPHAAFENCYNLNSPIDIYLYPPLQNLTWGATGGVYKTFANCNSLNAPINLFRQGMNYVKCFYGCTNLNQPVYYRTSPVTSPSNYTYYPDLSEMFYGCESFNQPVYVPTCTCTVRNMFYGCKKLNQPIQIPANSNHGGMFCGCESLQQSFTVPYSPDNSEQNLFSGCKVLNSSITFTGTPTDMSYTFRNCTYFNQTFTIPSTVRSATGIFQNAQHFQNNGHELMFPSQAEYLEGACYGSAVRNVTVQNANARLNNFLQIGALGTWYEPPTSIWDRNNEYILDVNYSSNLSLPTDLPADYGTPMYEVKIPSALQSTINIHKLFGVENSRQVADYDSYLLTFDTNGNYNTKTTSKDDIGGRFDIMTYTDPTKVFAVFSHYKMWNVYETKDYNNRNEWNNRNQVSQLYTPRYSVFVNFI